MVCCGVVCCGVVCCGVVCGESLLCCLICIAREKEGRVTRRHDLELVLDLVKLSLAAPIFVQPWLALFCKTLINF